MITEKTCYTVDCNGCGTELEYDEFRPVFDSPEQARSMLAEIGWWSDGTVDICEECRGKPHAFVPEIAGRDDVACDRCGLDQDDHEPVPAEGGA